MSSETLKPVYLVVGSDRPKIRRALGRLRARFAEENIEMLEADAASGAEAVAASNALGLFCAGGGKLVVVEGVERWRKEDAEAIGMYLRDPVNGSVLALVAGAPLKSDALTGAVRRGGEVLSFEVPKPREPTVWVRAELERLRTPADADAVRAIVEIVGDDVTTLASEVDKLTTWAGGETIGRRDVERLATPTGETFVWSLTDAWGERDVAGVLAAAESLLERRTREAFGIAAALAAYVGRVRAAQALAAEGAGAAAVAKRLRIKEYPARKALGHAANYSRDELDAAVVRLAALDGALKGASRLAPELELELALVEVTARTDAQAVAAA